MEIFYKKYKICAFINLRKIKLKGCLENIFFLKEYFLKFSMKVQILN